MVVRDWYVQNMNPLIDGSVVNHVGIGTFTWREILNGISSLVISLGTAWPDCFRWNRLRLIDISSLSYHDWLILKRQLHDWVYNLS